MNRKAASSTAQEHDVTRLTRKFSQRERAVIGWCLAYLVGDGIVALLLPAGCRWTQFYVFGAVLSAVVAFVVIAGWVRLPEVSKKKSGRKKVV